MNFLSILVAILVFGFLIFIHEGGHFLTARAFHVHVEEFSIGMGPKIFSHRSKKTGTAWSWRLFPIGGFVSMPGEDEISDLPDGFDKKPAWQRFLITAAGAVTNIVIAVLVMFFLVLAGKNLASNVVYSSGGFTEPNAAVQIQPGDRIVRVGNAATHIGNQVVYEIMHQGIEPIPVTVIRDGKTVVLENVVFASQSESGVTYGTPDIKVYSEPHTFLNCLKHAWFRSASTVKMIVDSIVDLFRGRYGIEAVSGPIGVTEAIGEAAKAGGISNVVYLAVVISMNLGIFNLLPLPALDGGRLIFLLLEMIFRRRLNPKIEGMIHFVGLALLMVLMVIVTIKDISTLF